MKTEKTDIVHSKKTGRNSLLSSNGLNMQAPNNITLVIFKRLDLKLLEYNIIYKPLNQLKG